MKSINKIIVIYFCLAVFACIFDIVYSLFSHGISSLSMILMPVVLVVCGCGVFMTIGRLFKPLTAKKGYRLFLNVYNSGIALLITAMLLQGILKIAGAESAHISWYYTAAYFFITGGAGILLGCHFAKPPMGLFRRR